MCLISKYIVYIIVFVYAYVYLYLYVYVYACILPTCLLSIRVIYLKPSQ